MPTRSLKSEGMSMMESIDKSLSAALHLPAQVDVLRKVIAKLESRQAAQDDYSPDSNTSSMVANASDSTSAGDVAEPKPAAELKSVSDSKDVATAKDVAGSGSSAAESMNVAGSTDITNANASTAPADADTTDDDAASAANITVLKAALATAEAGLLRVKAAMIHAISHSEAEPSTPPRPSTPVLRHSATAQTLEVFDRHGFPLSPPFIVDWKKRALEAEDEAEELRERLQEYRDAEEEQARQFPIGALAPVVPQGAFQAPVQGASQGTFQDAGNNDDA